MIHVGRLAPFQQWDQNTLERLFANELYPTGLDFGSKIVYGYPHGPGCVLLIPGRYWADRTDSITRAIADYEWILGIRTGDEEDLFDINRVEHPNIRWWVQTPRTGRDYGNARLFGVGYPPHFNQLPADPPVRHVDAFLAAQNTHERRHRAFEVLEVMRERGRGTVAFPTPGFTQGLEHAQYVENMTQTKVAPCPAGPASPDTFRLYEALEAHAVPIADDVTPGYDSHGYWRMLFPDAPFPILLDYDSLRGYINDCINEWPANANRIAAWWMREKRKMAHWLREDLEKLGAL